MRILIVHNHYQDLGGEDIVFQQECKLLSELPGVSISTLTFQNKKNFMGLFQFLLYPWNFVAARRLRRKIREVNPDIVHLHNIHYASGPLLIRTIKKSHIPLVMTLHNFRLLCPSATLFHNGEIFTDSLRQYFPWTAVRKRVLDNSLFKTFWTAGTYWLHRCIGTWNMVDRYLVLTDFAKKLFLESNINIPVSKFVIKPNCVIKRDNSVTLPKEDYFLYVGRLSPEKGILSLLNTIEPLEYPLIIVGDGPERQAVEAIARKHPHMRFLGPQRPEQISELMGRALALIVPSRCYEGMPMTILEAYSTGTPVIANGLGALCELIIPGETGYLVNINDVDSVEKALIKVANLNAGKRSEISRRCFQLYEQRFHPKAVTAQLMAVYQALTDSRTNA